MSNLIEPRILKGFRDFLPQQEIERQRIEAALIAAFESFGFVPIDTPLLEYTDVLLGKGGGETDKQIYRFQDHGNRDVSLRFDLTIPFARFMAAHAGELYLPFRRYHIAKVFRGENTQRGRYREFTQSDFDIVGVDSASADFEIIELVTRCLSALNVPRTTVHISHRGIFNRMLRHRGLQDASEQILRTVDKLAKIGRDETGVLLGEIVDAGNVDAILDFITAGSDNIDTLRKMKELAGGPGADIDRVDELLSLATEVGIGGSVFLDPAITRGLDYYTGVVFETFLDDLREIGSVCSGGRYNDLASLYTKISLPGVGGSVGLDRLMAALEELGGLVQSPAAPRILVMRLEEALVPYYHRLAARLRASGISCEVYPEERKLGPQFAYAEKKGIPFGLICGGDEHERGVVTIKDLRSRQNYENIDPDNVASRIADIA